MRKYAELIGWLFIFNKLMERFGIDELIEHKINELKAEPKPKSSKEAIKMGFQLND